MTKEREHTITTYDYGKGFKVEIVQEGGRFQAFFYQSAASSFDRHLITDILPHEAKESGLTLESFVEQIEKVVPSYIAWYLQYKDKEPIQRKDG